jgi:hypothetical protein
MGAADLLERIALAGVKLAAMDSDRLWAEPAELITDELRNLIRANKADLLRLLAANEPAPSGTPADIDGGKLADLDPEGRAAVERMDT